MLGLFMLGAVSRHGSVPDKGDAPGWLALARHYGLPTRLLDWTEAPLTAVFFAAYPPNGKDGRLWALNPALLNDRLMGQAGVFVPGRDNHVAELFKNAFRGAPPTGKRVAAVQPAEIDTRMLVQLSRFTVHESGTPLEELIQDDDVLRRYEISNSAKTVIAGELEAMGIRASSLFPDLETLAEFVSGLHYKRTPGAAS
jgi:hypothetical protein